MTCLFFGKCVVHYKAEKLEARGIGWSEEYAGCPGSVSARGSPSRNPEVVIAQIPANTSIRICFTLCSVCLQKANTARRVFAFTLAWEARETCHLEWRWGNTQPTCFPFFPFSERRRGEVSWVWESREHGFMSCQIYFEAYIQITHLRPHPTPSTRVRGLRGVLVRPCARRQRRVVRMRVFNSQCALNISRIL